MSSCTAVITCFNDGAFLEEAIKSVEDSSFNTEIIIVDDCSTDEATNQLLDKLSNNYSVIKIPLNSGVGNARNTAIKQAKTKYVLPLDADDIVDPEFIGNAVKFLEGNSEHVMVYGNVQRFGAEEELVTPPEFNGPMLLAGNYINNSSLYRKEAWEKTGGYDTSLPNYEDWDMWIQLYKQGGVFKKLDQVALNYRVKKVSKIGKTKDPVHRGNVVKFICEKHVDFYKQHVPEIVGNLHSVITTNEQKLAVVKGSDNLDMAETIVQLQQQLKDQKAYYEGSVFWKLKRIVTFWK